MSFVGGGWRSGQPTDAAVAGGAASTATVSSTTPSTAGRNTKVPTLTVTGTGFVAGAVVYANYGPAKTTFVNATTLTVDNFNPKPDHGGAGAIPIGVKNRPTEKCSATINFTAT